MKKRMKEYMIKVRKYLLKVWNPEDYSLIAKKSLSSDDIEAIKSSIKKQN